MVTEENPQDTSNEEAHYGPFKSSVHPACSRRNEVARHRPDRERPIVEGYNLIFLQVRWDVDCFYIYAFDDPATVSPVEAFQHVPKPFAELMRRMWIPLFICARMVLCVRSYPGSWVALQCNLRTPEPDGLCPLWKRKAAVGEVAMVHDRDTKTCYDVERGCHLHVIPFNEPHMYQVGQYDDRHKEWREHEEHHCQILLV